MTNKLIPAEVFPPGEFIREELEARGWTQRDLAEILGRPIQAVNEILSGKKVITPETAKELAAAFGTSPELFLNLENAYRLSQTKNASEKVQRRAQLYEKIPVAEAIRYKWLPKTRDLQKLEDEVCQLLGIASINENPVWAVAARMSDGYDELSPRQLIWLARCRQLAEQQKVSGKFQTKSVQKLAERLPHMFIEESKLSNIPKELSQVGVRTVFLQPMKSTKIDGAAFWLDGEPVVALSLRYDRVDSFWFTLMHELAHIVLHGKHLSILDVDIVGASTNPDKEKSQVEQEADEQACQWLIPQTELEQFLSATRPYYSQARIVEFAEKVQVHPGIVVGQLHYRGEISWSHSRKFLIKVRELLLVE